MVDADQGDQRRPGGQHSMRTYMIWNLHGWVQRDLPATDRNGGESSLPDVSAGTGGTHECNRTTACDRP